jgi:hypothetical protein
MNYRADSDIYFGRLNFSLNFQNMFRINTGGAGTNMYRYRPAPEGRAAACVACVRADDEMVATDARASLLCRRFKFYGDGQRRRPIGHRRSQ